MIPIDQPRVNIDDFSHMSLPTDVQQPPLFQEGLEIERIKRQKKSGIGKAHLHWGPRYDGNV